MALEFIWHSGALQNAQGTVIETQTYGKFHKLTCKIQCTFTVTQSSGNIWFIYNHGNQIS